MIKLFRGGENLNIIYKYTNRGRKLYLKRC